MVTDPVVDTGSLAAPAQEADVDQQSSAQLVRDVLGDDYLDFDVTHYGFEENVSSGHATVHATVAGGASRAPREIKGDGVGFVNAVFRAFKDAYSGEYPSLKSILFAGFTVQADFDTRGEDAGSDAVAKVVLTVNNSSGRPFNFENASRSVTLSAMKCTIGAIEYFVNTERAFVRLHQALDDAKSRNRSDLIERYQLQLARLVENTSYSEVIEKLRNA